MPVALADLATLGDTPVTIGSRNYANVYLRTDGTGVTTATDNGGGQVNCQYGPPGAYEKFKVRAQADGSFSFEAAAFPNVFLRLDGTGVTTQTANGGGLVNSQYGPPGPWEKFKARAQADGSFSFESAAFPNVFLRLNGTGVTATTAAGGGLVNAQFNASGGSAESFFLNMADQQLNFAMQHQEQTMWCWDASTVSIAKYYDAASTWTQCTLANNVLNRKDCCVAAGQVSPGNQGQWPDAALQLVKHFNQRQNNALSSVQLGAEMTKSAPVVVNIAWAGGGGHIVALRGRSTSGGVEHVSVGDPWYGDSDVTYDAFVNRYQGSGSWTVSYKTNA
jgi:hypothetical protein